MRQRRAEGKRKIAQGGGGAEHRGCFVQRQEMGARGRVLRSHFFFNCLFASVNLKIVFF